jgi:hypothetical protein
MPELEFKIRFFPSSDEKDAPMRAEVVLPSGSKVTYEHCALHQNWEVVRDGDVFVATGKEALTIDLTNDAKPERRKVL